MGIATLRRYHGAPKVAPAAEAAVTAPAASASAAEWKAYAAARGWDGSLTKAAIQDLEKADAESKSNEGDTRVGPNGEPETVPAGSVTPSEPEQGGGEGDNREPGKVGEGVTTSADLTGKPAESTD